MCLISERERYQKELNALFCPRKVLDVIQRQAETTNLNEQFHSQVLSVNADFFTKTMWCPLPHTQCTFTQLTRSADGFSVVADYFGRGVFKVMHTTSITLCYSASHCAIQCHIVLCSITLCYSASHCGIQHYIVLFSISSGSFYLSGGPEA